MVVPRVNHVDAMLESDTDNVVLCQVGANRG